MEWIADATGCASQLLADLRVMRELCDEIIRRMDLTVVGLPQWHQFPGAGGVTGLYLLSESHLACHTFPEHGLVTLNVYCCRARLPCDWDSLLRTRLEADDVTVRQVSRGLNTDSRCLTGGNP